MTVQATFLSFVARVRVATTTATWNLQETTQPTAVPDPAFPAHPTASALSFRDHAGTAARATMMAQVALHAMPKESLTSARPPSQPCVRLATAPRHGYRRIAPILGAVQVPLSPVLQAAAITVPPTVLPTIPRHHRHLRRHHCQDAMSVA